VDAAAEVDGTESWWHDWMRQNTYGGAWKDVVSHSLMTLKALTYAPTGGLVAAATTSLPEWPGGVRNWDYRFCWLRDSTFALYALMLSGFTKEAGAWRDWLLRAVAGDPAKLQIMYGVAGERRLPEIEADWLPGYENSRPVRIGNGAVHQLQLDVYGEVMDALHVARLSGVDADPDAWALQKYLLHDLETRWREPDEGIWEVRGPRRHFTHSKLMAWVAFDRAVASVEQLGLDGPAARWRQIRQEIHDEICRNAFDAGANTFVQSYGARELDASVLTMPLLGFLPASDPRIVGTVQAIEKGLGWRGFIQRYAMAPGSEQVDGLPPGEGTFLLCTFWLADCYAMMGRYDDAQHLFERLVALTNDVGLLAEQYDPSADRMLGNFPQAFSHVGLINTAMRLSKRGNSGANS
jgi:GH15 family glucan-1,4-alpha-glucosidase